MINLVIGRQGSGKTLLLVKKAEEYFNSGRKVYSNVHLNFPYSPIDYNDIVNCEYENAIIILDEIHLLLPARNSMSKRNREICDSFLSMVRKKGLVIYGSTQTERKVDIRFREEADFIYRCTKYAFINGRWTYISQSKKLDKIVPINIKTEIWDSYTENILIQFFRANRLFDLYDTTQIIKVLGLEIDKKEKKQREE